MQDEEMIARARAQTMRHKRANSWTSPTSNDTETLSSASHVKPQGPSSSEPCLPTPTRVGFGGETQRPFLGVMRPEKNQRWRSIRPNINNDIPWQIFHEEKPGYQKELFWDPFGKLLEENADLQQNRGFSGFSQKGHVFRNNLFSGPFHWRILQRASKSGGLSALTHFLQNALDAPQRRNEDISILNLDSNNAPPTRVTDIMDFIPYWDSPSKNHARIILVNRLNASVMEALGTGLSCNIEFFNDHLKRLGDDVELLLPSKLRSQPHVAIPYGRAYRLRDVQKGAHSTGNLRSSFSHGCLAVTEERVSVWISESTGTSWTAVVLCDLAPRDMSLFPPGVKFTDDMRDSFEATISREYQSDLRLENPYIIVKIFLKLARTRWARVLRDQEEYLRSVTGNQLSDPNVALQEKQAFDDYLKHMLGLLEINLQLVDPLQKKTWHRAHAMDVEYEELKEDYKFLIAKMRSQIQQNASTIPVITAMMAVEESRKAIEQANDVKALTTLATIYIPLSFIAGVFGMNVTTFDPDINVPIWSFFAIALPVTALSMALVWYWNSILRAGPLIRDAFVTLIKRLVERFCISPIPRGGVAKGLALGGGTSIAVGRPFLPTTHRMNDEMMNMRAYEEAGV